MNHPAWLLVPWAVFALAALIKAWRLFAVARRQLWHQPARRQAPSIEELRAGLERCWNKDGLSPG